MSRFEERVFEAFKNMCRDIEQIKDAMNAMADAAKAQADANANLFEARRPKDAEVTVVRPNVRKAYKEFIEEEENDQST